MKKTLRARYTPILFCVAILSLQIGAAKAQPHPPVTQQLDTSSKVPPLSGAFMGMANVPGDKHQVLFERSSLDFLTQGIGQENCVSVPLTNRSDKPKKLTALISEDPVHFRLDSPVPAMMPMTVRPHASLTINICFKADKEKSFKSALIAVIEGDTTSMMLNGEGIKPKPQEPLPTALAVHVLKGKRHAENIFKLDLPDRGTVTLEIIDELGKSDRHIMTNELKSAGVYEANFNWLDDAMKPMAAGKYYVRVQLQSIEKHTTATASARVELKP